MRRVLTPYEASEELLLQQQPAKRVARCAPSNAQWYAFANLLKTMIGSGLLTLPWATAQFGLVPSLLGLLYLAYLSQAAIRLTVRCVAFSPLERKTLVDELRHTGSLHSSRRQSRATEASHATDNEGRRSRVSFAGDALRDKPRATVVNDGHGAGSWQIISTQAFGEPARVFTIVLLMAAQAGASVSYFDFVTAALGTYLGTPRLVNIISVWAVLCALSLLKQLKSVAWLSAAGLLTYLFVLALLGYFGAEQMVSEGVLPAYQPSALAKPAGLGAWFGPAIFAFEGMGTALSIYEAMEDADPRPFFSVVSSTYLISYVLYGGVGAFGYLAWQGGVCPVILDCFPTYNTTPGAVNSVNADLAMAAHVALSIILGLSFVLQVHVLPLIASEKIPSDTSDNF